MATRLAAEFAGAAPPSSGPAPEPEGRRGAGRADGHVAHRLRDARIRAERAVDTALDAVGDAFDLCSDLVEAAARRATGAPGELGLCITCAPGDVGTATCWLHNTTSSMAGTLRPHVGELRSQRGAALAAALAVAPERVVDLAAGTSASFTVTVTVATSAAPGRYFGLVFVDGLDDEPPLPIEVDVIEPGGRR